MKRKILVAVILLTCGMSFLRAEEDAKRVNRDADVSNFKELMRALSLQGTAPNPSPPSKLQTIQEFVQTRNLPAEVYVPAAEDIAEEFLAPLTLTDGRIWPTNGRAAHFVVSIMGSLGDTGFLPWLELQATESQWSGVRERAAISYVKIAGLDSLLFVQTIFSKEQTSSENTYLIRRYVRKELFCQIEMAEAKKVQQEKVDLAYKLLIEQAKKATDEGEAEELDTLLNKHLPDYPISIQREDVLSRFLNSTNETARGIFASRHEELLKTPQAQRTDLAKRFPGLTELKAVDEVGPETPASTEDN